MQNETSGIQSVERAFLLLEAFTSGHPEARVTDLATLTGMGQSTVSRLLATLERLGYVERDERSGLYRLGHGVITLAGTAMNQADVHRESRQIAQNLAAELGLGANVAVRDGSELFWLLNFEGRDAPRSTTLMGRRGPLHATGLGKVLLSGLGAEEIRRLLSGDAAPRAFTPHTLTELPRLLAAVENVGRQGYATEVEELAFGRGCVAAPIRDRSGRICAALSVSGPLTVLNLAEREATLASRAIEAADAISIGLGYVASFRRLEPAASADVRA
jgi:DNA-binding IclR family transcriptional regulator